ncbi:hypothetical protein HQ560_14560, partial [bacterium]|nr:hypothetical protein [bacterium]
MAEMKLGVVLHGVTGRMGDMARRALEEIAGRGGVAIDGDRVVPVPIGVGRDEAKLAAYAQENGLAEFTTSIDDALDRARALNGTWQLYHNAVSTGARHDALLGVLPLLDPSQTAVFCEKPVAANYREGWEIVEALERGRFLHGVVHDMLETPGVRKACQLLPSLRPLSCQMT